MTETEIITAVHRLAAEALANPPAEKMADTGVLVEICGLCETSHRPAVPVQDAPAENQSNALRAFLAEMVSESSERLGQAQVWRVMMEWAHEEAAEAEAQTLLKWAKKLESITAATPPHAGRADDAD